MIYGVLEIEWWKFILLFISGYFTYYVITHFISSIRITIIYFQLKEHSPLTPLPILDKILFFLYEPASLFITLGVVMLLLSKISYTDKFITHFKRILMFIAPFFIFSELISLLLIP